MKLPFSSNVSPVVSTSFWPFRYVEGEGLRVVSERRDVNDSVGVTLILENMDGGKMPNLKGLSLKDALEIAGNFRMNVEYTGKGRVVAQSPKADEVLRKGQVCKLTLKERS